MLGNIGNLGCIGGQVEAPRQETTMMHIHDRLNAANLRAAELIMSMKRELNRILGDVPENPQGNNEAKEARVSETQRILSRLAETEVLLTVFSEQVDRLKQI